MHAVFAMSLGIGSMYHVRTLHACHVGYLLSMHWLYIGAFVWKNEQLADGLQKFGMMHSLSN